ncbi:hypothetical protein DFH11DRAFT_1824374 [Phellopilus nigrolimitatus]|nr:hypothetical protein DFH11DRAFT_1824374 [Phellopilus nigrolimitatus]
MRKLMHYSRYVDVVCTSCPSSSPRRLPRCPLVCPTAVRPRSLLRDYTFCCSLGLFCSARLAVELEKKVAKITTKRCSTGEVQALQKELLEWLGVDKTKHGGDQQQHTAIQLSHLLLRAILMNHIAHSEAAKVSASRRSDLIRFKGSVVTSTQKQRADQPRRLLLLLRVHLRPAHSTSNPGSGRTTPTAGLVLAPGPGPSPMSFPGSPNGTSSTSATAAALQHPASPSPASRAYHHTRSASMMQHRATTPAPAVHAISSASSTLSSGSRRSAMTPAAVCQRSASQVAGGRASKRDARRAVEHGYAMRGGRLGAETEHAAGTNIYTLEMQTEQKSGARCCVRKQKCSEMKGNGGELREIVVLIVRHDEHDYVVVAGSAGSRRRVLMATRSRVDHRRGQRRRSARGGEAGGDVEKPVPSGPLRALVDITKFSVFIGSIIRSMGSKAQKDLTRCVTAPH